VQWPLPHFGCYPSCAADFACPLVQLPEKNWLYLSEIDGIATLRYRSFAGNILKFAETWATSICATGHPFDVAPE
jgi:hypothetical protein